MHGLCFDRKLLKSEGKVNPSTPQLKGLDLLRVDPERRRKGQYFRNFFNFSVLGWSLPRNSQIFPSIRSLVLL